MFFSGGGGNMALEHHDQKDIFTCEKFHQLLAVGRWFPPGTPVFSTR